MNAKELAVDEPSRLMDEMLAAQTRFAQAWRDGAPLTEAQIQDEKIRDTARARLLKMLRGELMERGDPS